MRKRDARTARAAPWASRVLHSRGIAKHDGRFQKVLKRQGSRDEIMAEVRRLEAAVVPPPGARPPAGGKKAAR